MHKLGLADSAQCECGVDELTANHIISRCPLYCPPNGIEGLRDLDDATLQWLSTTCPDN